MKDLHALPKVRDSWSYLYVEHCRIDQEAKAIAIHDENGKVPIPCATLMLLMLGPGTSITHAAVKVLADNGCLVTWTGEGAVRFYAHGMGETRSSRNLIQQARLSSDPVTRLAVVMRLYTMRFSEPLADTLTLQQIRGKEGVLSIMRSQIPTTLLQTPSVISTRMTPCQEASGTRKPENLPEGSTIRDK